MSATTTVTADLIHNSAGTNRSGAGTIPTTPVTFATTAGSLTATSGVPVNGVATTLKRAGDTGPATASSTVDHETASDSVNLAAPESAFQSRNAAEGAGSVNVTVSLDLPNDEDVTFHYATSNGTTGAADYTSTSGNALIPAGSLTYLIPVSMTQYAIDEADETFNVTISAASVGIATVNDVGPGKGGQEGPVPDHALRGEPERDLGRPDHPERLRPRTG